MPIGCWFARGTRCPRLIRTSPQATSNIGDLTSAQIRKSGVLGLASAVADAAGVWYNLTKAEDCFDIASSGFEQADNPTQRRAAPEAPAAPSAGSFGTGAKALPVSPDFSAATAAERAQGCPACPPCDDCPPCPISYCDWEDTAPCSYCDHELSKARQLRHHFEPCPAQILSSVPPYTWRVTCTFLPRADWPSETDVVSELGLQGFSWGGICSNEALSQIDIKGVGRDIFWPPQVENRSYTVETVVGPRDLVPSDACVPRKKNQRNPKTDC